jgi:hypothetical protein
MVAAQQNTLDFAHVALLWSLAEGPRKVAYFCPDGDNRMLSIFVLAANELRGMGLVSVAGDSSETLEFSLTDLGEEMALNLSLGHKQRTHMSLDLHKAGPKLGNGHGKARVNKNGEEVPNVKPVRK